ncbi:MAG: YHYH protein [Porticoccaceae bacterium]|uniref:YHYH protein n=1 Tax=Thalassospira sp. TaxID=1912094 RepID=UPI003A87DEAA
MHVLFVVLALVLWGPPEAKAHEIKTCKCDEGCYTDEVSNLVCNRDKARFSANGLPDPSHPVMTGITASNQQFPAAHDFDFEIILNPTLAAKPTPTEAGPAGVAINGVPIFDPSTQGPVNAATGKRPSAAEAGELDECGGHAGRGDDYHYHIAPKCLIDDLGNQWVDIDKKPVGYAMDGFPILALGWFDPANSVEALLDACRGMKDDKGSYFYNVETKPSWDVLNCLSGTPRGFAKDRWTPRKDRTGAEIVGLPIPFEITSSSAAAYGNDMCRVMTGTLRGEQLLQTNGTTKRINAEDGALFYCNQACYGLFFEADRKSNIRGRAIYYDYITDGCPSGFNAASISTFAPYEGPAQTRKGPAGTGKGGPGAGPGGGGNGGPGNGPPPNPNGPPPRS